MIIVKNSEKQKFSPTKTTCVFEYDTKDTDIGGATATIKGRYPEKGFVVNLKVKQIAYVISGSGAIMTPDEKRALTQGDMIFITDNEKFAWDGDMELFIANAPRFDPAQYKQMD